jgi:hypothetical protein
MKLPVGRMPYFQHCSVLRITGNTHLWFTTMGCNRTPTAMSIPRPGSLDLRQNDASTNNHTAQTSTRPCLRYPVTSPPRYTIHACARTPRSRTVTHTFRNGRYLYTFRTILQAWDAVVYKHKPQHAVSNGILHAELHLPEHVGDVTFTAP